MSTLGLCPLCKGKPLITERTDDERNAYCAHVTISCENCGCSITRSGDTSKGGYADNSKARANAISAWNSRS